MFQVRGPYSFAVRFPPHAFSVGCPKGKFAWNRE